jgi:hypothetical protein
MLQQEVKLIHTKLQIVYFKICLESQDWKCQMN